MSPSPFNLAGKVCLVTGAAGGIGAGIAEMLAEAGGMVVIADVDAAGARALGAGNNAGVQDRRC